MSKYQGDIKDFPEEIVEWMLDERVRQGGDRSAGGFEKNRGAKFSDGGFEWRKSEHDAYHVLEVVFYKNFAHFYAHIKPKLSKPMEQPVYTPKKKSYKVMYQVRKANTKPMFESSCEVFDFDESLTAGKCFELCFTELNRAAAEIKGKCSITDFVPIA